MYDSVTLTKKCLPEQDFRILNPDSWKPDVSPVGDLLSVLFRIPLNKHEHEGKEYCNGAIGISYNYRFQSLSIVVSLPKLVYGSSIYEIQSGDKEKVFKALLESTKDYIEFYFDLGEMNLARLDNSVNMDMSLPVSCYLSVLDSYLPKSIGAQDKSTYGGTVRMISKSESDVFYDKVEDCNKVNKKRKERDSVFPIVKDSVSPNKLRYEIQNKSAQAISNKKRYGKVLTFSDIWKDEIVERSCKLRLITFDNLIRQVEPKYKAFSINDFQEDLINMKAVNKKPMLDFPWYVLLKSGVMTITDVESIMRGAEFSRKAIYNTIEKLKSLQTIESKERKLIDEIYAQVEQRSKVA
jgi:hypothetical protein